MRISKLLALLAAACTAALAVPAGALDIALTNDDGWNAPGIQIMRSALLAAGHNVTLAAPLTDQSGSSMALDLGLPLTVKKEADGQYSVALRSSSTIPPGTSAEPGTSALVAIGIAQESGRSPDLLISGINTSAHIGMTSLRSGTVGAAAYAVASVLNGPVPAMAVGTDAPTCVPPAATCPEQQSHFQVVADFIVRFVAHLQTKPGFLAREEGLLPSGVGLIVSYPKSDAIRGVKIAVQSEGALSPVLGVKVAGGIFCQQANGGPLTPCSDLTVGQSQTARMVLAPDPTPEVRNSDLDFYAQGYVTIVPFVPDITAQNPLVFKSILPGFVP